MSSELARRVATALVGVAVILGVLLYGGYFGVALVTFVVTMGMLFEFCGIVLELPDRAEKRLVTLSIAALVIAGVTFQSGIEYGALILSFLLLGTYFLVTASRHPEPAGLLEHLRELLGLVFGLVYLVFCPLFLLSIRASANGLHWTLLFLFIVWAVDIGAYFAGRAFGRRKLYPLISPKKTLEGAAGGYLSAIAVALLYKALAFPDLGWGAAILVPLLVGSFAQAGDLVESFLKRAYGKKDSGSILPGHGGFLDRFDGVVFSAPVMYACLRIFS